VPSSTNGFPNSHCAYCKSTDHVITSCPRAKCRVSHAVSASHNLLVSSNHVFSCLAADEDQRLHPFFAPFSKIGQIETNGDSYPVNILRDTGAVQSLLRRSAIPPSAITPTGDTRLIKGVGDQTIKVELVEINLKSEFLSGSVLVGVVDSLPAGVDFLLAMICSSR
jgi:hypothetical protein